MSLSVTPPGSVLASTSLAAEGLQKTMVNGQPAIIPASAGSMVLGGITQVTQTVTTSDNIQVLLQGSENFIDFQIAGTGAQVAFDYYNKIFLEVTVLNGSGASALTVPPAWYMFSRIEMRVQDNPVKTYSYAQQMEDWFFSVCPRMEFQSSYELLGYPVDDFSSVAGFAIPASSSQTFFIPLHYLFTELVEGIPLAAIVTPITLRFYFNQGSGYYFSTSASTSLSVSTARIIASGQQLDGVGRTALTAMAKGSVIQVPCIQPQVRPFTFGAVTAGTSSGTVLSNVQGACAEFSMWLYTNGNPSTPQGKLGTTTYSEFIFNNQAGQLVNTGARTQQELFTYFIESYGKEMVVYPQSIPSSTTPTLRYVDQGPRLSFCQHIVPTKRSLVRHGSFSLKGYETVQVTAPAGGYADARGLGFYYILAQFVVDAVGNVTFVYQSA